MTSPALLCQDLTLCHGNVEAVHELDFRLERGSLTALIGPNGSGKTTLLNAVVGLHRPRSGRIDLDPALGRSLAYLPQNAGLDREVPVTVRDVVALGAWRRTGSFGALGPAAAAAVDAAVRRVGLAGLGSRLISALSGGELQRVLFARLLVEDAQLILLDEPFNAVDAQTREDLFQVIHEWHGERRTVLVVLHDLDLVRSNFPDVLLLAGKRVAQGATSATLTPANLQRAHALAEIWARRAA